MELKPRKNEYQHDVVDCPLCPKWVYVRATSKLSPDPLRDLKRHITNDAKNEAFAMALTLVPVSAEKTYEVKPFVLPIETPHLDYYREHTSEVPAVPKVSARRAYDSDLTL